MQRLPHEVENPFYDYRFKTLPKICFRLTIDGEAGTLHVEVLGANLSYTFMHTKGRDSYNATELGSNLTRKTVGYSALIASDDERIVLAWAESGHGLSSAGDMLDATPFALHNASWTRRAIAVTELLGMKTGSLLDNPRGRHAKNADRLRGIYSGSHVEVKLATHAVFFLLRLFGITDDLDSVTASDLAKLQPVTWRDGTRPAFEIHFSREPCHRCKEFVGRLKKLTGIELQLRPHDRLDKFNYEKADHGINPNEGNMYPEDDTVSVCSEAESVITLPAEDQTMADSAMAEHTTTADGSQTNTQDDDVLYIGCNTRSVTPALVIDLTKEPRRERAPLDVADGDVDKPLPATAVHNEPAWMVSLRRSPRPYCSSVLGHGCTCGTSCSDCARH